MDSAWRNFTNIFLGQFSSSFFGQHCNFRYRFHFEGNYDAWISQVRCVKQHGSLQNCTMMVKMQFWRKTSNVVSVIEFPSKSVNHFINLELCQNSKLISYSPVKIGRAIRKMSYFWHHNKKLGHLSIAKFNEKIFIVFPLYFIKFNCLWFSLYILAN